MTTNFAESTVRVARLEQLLARVKTNATRPRTEHTATPAVALQGASAAQFDVSRVIRSSEPVVDYEIDDLSDVDVVVIDADASDSMPPALPAESGNAILAQASDGLPDGVIPLAEGGEFLPAGVAFHSEPAAPIPAASRPGYYSQAPHGESQFGAAELGEPGSVLGGSLLLDTQADESLVAGDALFAEEVAIPLQPKRDSQRPTVEHPIVESFAPNQPTMEQLGATIGLEVGAGPLPELELDDHSLPPGDASDLELALPSRGFAGAYDENLASPASAQDDLAQYRAGIAQSGVDVDQFGVDAAANEQQASPAVFAPQVVDRSELSPAVPVAEIVDNRVRTNDSFVALLDGSMSISSR